MMAQDGEGRVSVMELRIFTATTSSSSFISLCVCLDERIEGRTDWVIPLRTVQDCVVGYNDLLLTHRTAYRRSAD